MISFCLGLCVSLVGFHYLSSPHTSPGRIESAASPIAVVNQTPEAKVVTLRAVGDVMLGRSVNRKTRQHQDWNWPFAAVTNLSPVDITLGNLEAPLASPCPQTDTGMIFCAPPEAVVGLNSLGFSLMSLANNHALNYGRDGLLQTQKTLLSQGIEPLGAHQSSVVQVNGIHLGFIAVNDLEKYPDLSPLISDLAATTSATVMLVHWGNEYQTEPSIRQQQLAKSWFDAGADIIIGAHPHVIQPIKIHDTQLVAYSLGNFVFDQMFSQATRKGLILDLTLTFTDHQLTHLDYTTHPVTIYDYGQPRLD